MPGGRRRNGLGGTAMRLICDSRVAWVWDFWYGILWGSFSSYNLAWDMDFVYVHHIFGNVDVFSRTCNIYAL